MSNPQPPMTWEEFQELEAALPGRRIAWGNEERAYGELRLPEGPGPHPVGVLVHGGCWSSIADLGYLGHLAEALCAQGWATWSPEFRRTDDAGGEWPNTLHDVGRGLDYLRVLAEAHPINLAQVVTIGHSSGGHLALWLAARPGLPDSEQARPLRGEAPLAVRGVVGLAPISDLLDFNERETSGCPPTSVADLLGGDPREHADRVHLADPAARLPLGVPQLLLTGALDATVPPEHVRIYGDRARAAGDVVSIVEIDGAGHFEVVAPGHPTWGDTAAHLHAFLGRMEG